jgi:methylphosphotriester-DNA--protein-cysteine methyltransferase
MSKPYKIQVGGRTVLSETPGVYAGWKPGKIFGRLDCKSGMRIKKENRVFFHTLEDAVDQGYRPCQNCHPINEVDFQRIKYSVSEKSLEEFYRRKAY